MKWRQCSSCTKSCKSKLQKTRSNLKFNELASAEIMFSAINEAKAKKNPFNPFPQSEIEKGRISACAGVPKNVQNSFFLPMNREPFLSHRE
jgi:hypothetical protein